MVSVWTDSAQSFLDAERYDDELGANQISRAELLLCRHNLRLQDSSHPWLAWRPFGSVDKSDVELELWPWLDTKSSREYQHFVWYPGMKNARQSVESVGFRRETGRHIPNVPDDLAIRSSDTNCGDKPLPTIAASPSKVATLTMLDFLVEDARGGRHWGNTAMPDALRRHPWLDEWEGLLGMEVPCKDTGEITDKEASSWCMEWLKRQGDAEHIGGTLL